MRMVTFCEGMLKTIFVGEHESIYVAFPAKHAGASAVAENAGFKGLL